MKAFNKNNFSIASLVKREQREQVHVTDDYTEVTNGHFLVRVSSVEIKKEDLPEGPAGSKPSEAPIGTVVSCSSAKKICDAIPKTHMPILNAAWQGKNSDKEFIEFLTTDLEDWTPVIVRRITEHFPDTDKILSETRTPQAKIAFDVGYMKRLCEQLIKMGVKTTKLDIYGQKEAMEMKTLTGDGQDVTILLMLVVRED